MDENKNTPQNELSPEDQLDQLLAAFLAEPDTETPQVPEDVPSQPVETAPAEEAAEVPVPVLPEEMPVLDMTEEPVEEISEPIPEAMPEIEPEVLWPADNLDTPELPEEIGPDEQAVAAAGLTHPEDLEFEKILEETLNEDWDDADADAEHHVQAPLLPEDAMLIEAVAEEEHSAEETEQASPSGTEPELPEISADDDAAQAETPEEALPPRKGRPKNKNTYGFFGIPHILSTLVWLAIIVFIGAGLGRMIWECAADVLALGREDQTVTITITDTDDLDSVAEKLHQTGLVKYPGLFKLYGQLTDAMDDIRTGTFKLNTLYDYHALVDQMAGNASRITTNVVIPEGYNCAQIFNYLEEKGVCSAEKLKEAAANADLGDYWFLEGVERGTPYCLEGYLFPDTYEFYLGHDPEAVLDKFLSNFNKRFTDIMKEKLDTLNATLSDMMRSHGLSEDYIASHQMTIREVVIVASMIEKETANNDESYNISSVIYNRLTNPAVYPYLNIDATLVYITGHGQLTNEDKLIDSPYNTYLYAGLIPGPISNPGRASLDAALDPENTEYHFYALDPSIGAHHFSETYQEHLDFLASLQNNGG